jgi:hypothetical protein
MKKIQLKIKSLKDNFEIFKYILFHSEKLLFIQIIINNIFFIVFFKIQLNK